MMTARELLKGDRIKDKIKKAKLERGMVKNEIEAAYYKKALAQSKKAAKVVERKGHDGKNRKGKDHFLEEIVPTKDRKAVVEFKKVEDKEGLDGLKPIEHQILLHWAAGCSFTEISRIVGLSAANVSKATKKDAFKIAYNELMADSSKVSKDSQSLLQYNSSAAARRLIHLMNNARSESVQLQATKDVLDRAGVAQVKRVESVNEHTVGINLEGYPDEYKAQLMEQRLGEINDSRRRRLVQSGDVDVGSFEVPEIVEGEVIEERIDYQEATFGQDDTDTK